MENSSPLWELRAQQLTAELLNAMQRLSQLIIALNLLLCTEVMLWIYKYSQ